MTYKEFIQRLSAAEFVELVSKCKNFEEANLLIKIRNNP